jgi:hypothetical protein
MVHWWVLVHFEFFVKVQIEAILVKQIWFQLTFSMICSKL